MQVRLRRRYKQRRHLLYPNRVELLRIYIHPLLLLHPALLLLLWRQQQLARVQREYRIKVVLRQLSHKVARCLRLLPLADFLDILAKRYYLLLYNWFVLVFFLAHRVVRPSAASSSQQLRERSHLTVTMCLRYPIRYNLTVDFFLAYRF